MVQVYIKIADNSNLEEWTIIELQGDLEIENGKSLEEKFMGDLHFNKDGTPIMILGHHVLFGKVTNLDKPMVLMKKVRSSIDNLNDKNENMIEEPIETKFKTEYVVQAVMRKKILFNKRPKPIVF